MKALLDTHAFLWWNLDAPQLSPAARAFIADGSNEIFVSAATAWEIAIKYRKGRLELPEPPEQYIVERLMRHRFTPLPIQMQHATAVARLPDHHSDPFDRLLVAQSLVEDLPLISADPSIQQYAVTIIW